MIKTMARDYGHHCIRVTALCWRLIPVPLSYSPSTAFRITAPNSIVYIDGELHDEKTRETFLGLWKPLPGDQYKMRSAASVMSYLLEV